MTTLVLVRHGATTWNDNGYFQGLKDEGRLSAPPVLTEKQG